VLNGLYPRLAWVNLGKNRQTWLPYLFTCIGTIMMFYIMLTLDSDPALGKMSGGSTLGYMLDMGVVVIGFFAVILMFFAHSFIMKQRKKEFGLYNILGMEKRHIARLLAWETLYTAVIAYTAGIALGILFSKLMQLLLLKLLRFDIRFGLYVSPLAMGITALLFAAIFLLTLLNSMRVIHFAKPVELLHGTQEGEREPKSKWVLAVLGIMFLGAGYGLAVSVKSGLEAIQMFFIAVICVIIGTYLLFTAFSIVFLKRLRANKDYYYKTGHFATVSGMLYRMKKNAGGLASICILSTMVLVTVSTTVCLYMGVDEMLDIAYPGDLNVTAAFSADDSGSRDGIMKTTLDAVAAQGRTVTDCRDYLSLSYDVDRSGDSFASQSHQSGLLGGTGDVDSFTILTAADYNAMAGTNVFPAGGEALLYTPNHTGKAFSGGSLTLSGITYKITMLDSFPVKEQVSIRGGEQYFLVVADFDALKAAQAAQLNGDGEGKQVYMYYLAVNMDGTDQQKIDCAAAVDQAFYQENNEFLSVMTSSRAENYKQFLANYGGLFFLGIFLGFLFLMATVLIIYYKQVTEGYDDRERFRIMQNVGMTKSEVKSTIHSQILIVFFLPLAATIIHVGFAFPMIRHMLSVFGLTNITLFAYCTLAAIGVFAVLYALVYLRTSKTYYKIVS
jgi:putative ABC transport system permease protein